MWDDQGGGESSEGSLISSGWDAIEHGLNAVGDAAAAAGYASAAVGEAVLGGAAHVDAGLLDAVGADELASDIRSGANTLQDMASANLDEAGNQLSSAADEIY